MDENQPHKIKFPMIEILKSIPEILGVRINEEPKYNIIKKDGAVEVRAYAKQLHAKVTLNNIAFNDFKEQGFNQLANYIFGGNQSKTIVSMTSPVLQKQSGTNRSAQNIAMTAPVLQEQVSDKQWTMTFILPAKYNLQNAPRPNDSKVYLAEQPPFDAVTIRYTGNNSAKSVKKNEAELKNWLAKNTQYKADGKFFVAQYDAPFAVPFFKRNEIFAKINQVDEI